VLRYGEISLVLGCPPDAPRIRPFASVSRVGGLTTEWTTFESLESRGRETLAIGEEHEHRSGC
jgi:hypothetical protein